MFKPPHCIMTILSLRVRFALCLLLLCWIGSQTVNAQKVSLKVALNYEMIAARVDVRVIKALETYINNFVNNSQWVKTDYSPNSIITGNILFTFTSVDNNVFSGNIIVQAERLVFNSSYKSLLLNFRDNDVSFEFNLNQIDDFNEVTFASSSSPLRVNLPAILKFYAMLILGLDADSFGEYRGSSYFSSAFQITTSASSVSEIASGWVAFANDRNRFMLIEEMSSDKYKFLRTGFYQYYRNCLDQLFDSKEKAIQGLVNCFNELYKVKKEVTYSLHLVSFLDNHKDEIKNIINYIQDPKYKRQVMQLYNGLY